MFIYIFIEKMNSQTNGKDQWCHIFTNGGSTNCSVFVSREYSKGMYNGKDLCWCFCRKLLCRASRRSPRRLLRA